MGKPHDELFDSLSRLLEQPVIASDDDILVLLDANARLRALAVQLSNLVGDLPPLREVKLPRGHKVNGRWIRRAAGHDVRCEWKRTSGGLAGMTACDRRLVRRLGHSIARLSLRTEPPR